MTICSLSHRVPLMQTETLLVNLYDWRLNAKVSVGQTSAQLPSTPTKGAYGGSVTPNDGYTDGTFIQMPTLQSPIRHRSFHLLQSPSNADTLYFKLCAKFYRSGWRHCLNLLHEKHQLQSIMLSVSNDTPLTGPFVTGDSIV